MSRSQRISAPTLRVDLSAVAHNVRLLRQRSGSELMAVVKADGFGHDATAVAATALANGATWLGTATIDEALTLRADGIEQAPLLAWLHPLDADFEAAIRAGVDLAVPSLEHLQLIRYAARRAGRPAAVHLHADLGMSRDGCPPADWIRLCHDAERLQSGGTVEVVGIMGHLGCAATPNHPQNRVGIEAFARSTAVARAHGLRPRWRQLAATPAVLALPAARAVMARAGAGLYGIDPARTSAPLRGAVTLSAPVVAVREVDAGTPIGYDAAYVTPGRTRLAQVAIGYADGLPRAASASSGGGADVWLGGRRCRVVGLISMDQMVVDIGDTPVVPGDPAIVFGPGHHGEPTLREWARAAGTIEHDIVTGLKGRVRRVLDQDDHVGTEPRP